MEFKYFFVFLILFTADFVLIIFLFVCNNADDDDTQSLF